MQIVDKGRKSSRGKYKITQKSKKKKRIIEKEDEEKEKFNFILISM